MSEAPKEAPIARKYDSRHELEEVKSTEQMKEEVSILPSICVYQLVDPCFKLEVSLQKRWHLPHFIYHLLEKCSMI